MGDLCKALAPGVGHGGYACSLSSHFCFLVRAKLVCSRAQPLEDPQQLNLPMAAISKPGGNYLQLFGNYLKSFVFSKIVWIVCGLFVKNVPYLRQDHWRLLEIVDYLHYSRLF